MLAIIGAVVVGVGAFAANWRWPAAIAATMSVAIANFLSAAQGRHMVGLRDPSVDLFILQFVVAGIPIFVGLWIGLLAKKTLRR